LRETRSVSVPERENSHVSACLRERRERDERETRENCCKHPSSTLVLVKQCSSAAVKQCSSEAVILVKQVL